MLPRFATDQTLFAMSETAPLAIASLVLGILSFMGMSILLLPPLLAVIFGHVAYGKIRRSPELEGSGLAIAGFATGYASFLTFMLLVAMAVPAFNKVRENALEKTIENNLRQIASAGQQRLPETGEEDATYDELVEDGYFEDLLPVQGEDYSELVVTPETTTLSVVTDDGTTITYLF